MKRNGGGARQPRRTGAARRQTHAQRRGSDSRNCRTQRAVLSGARQLSHSADCRAGSGRVAAPKQLRKGCKDTFAGRPAELRLHQQACRRSRGGCRRRAGRPQQRLERGAAHKRRRTPRLQRLPRAQRVSPRHALLREAKQRARRLRVRGHVGQAPCHGIHPAARSRERTLRCARGKKRHLARHSSSLRSASSPAAAGCALRRLAAGRGRSMRLSGVAC